MKLSIIIPALNEEAEIGRLIRYLKENSSPENIAEIIVADGNSDDRTAEIVVAEGGRIVSIPIRKKSVQMNRAAREAIGEGLYFLHADSYPPPGFDAEVLAAMRGTKPAGCYRLTFDVRNRFLDSFCWFTRFKGNFFRGGDQSLFISKTLFESIGGFNEEMTWMEDVEIFVRIKKHTSIQVLPRAVKTSTRKYHKNGFFRLQFLFALIQLLYYTGFSQVGITNFYNRYIKWYQK